MLQHKLLHSCSLSAFTFYDHMNNKKKCSLFFFLCKERKNDPLIKKKLKQYTGYAPGVAFLIARHHELDDMLKGFKQKYKHSF